LAKAREKAAFQKPLPEGERQLMQALIFEAVTGKIRVH